MIKVNQYARTSALPAIAAALALSSTPVLAQQVPPVPADPAPATQPAPTTDATPAATDTSATPPDTSADSTASTTTSVRKRTVRTTVAKAAPVTARTTTKTATHSVAAAAPVPPAARATSAEAPAPVSHRPPPIVDLNAKPTPAATPAVATKPHKKKDATLPIAGGALAFLAVGGAAVAMTRRREDDEEWTDEERLESDPAETAVEEAPVVRDEQPATTAPTAFGWNGTDRVDEPAQIRREGESHVERAYRGPTPDNPSLSLKKRLKRAHFFDQRERDAAAGEAVPVDSTAGLPERMLEDGDIHA
jgi:hypothetical protein